MVTKSTRDWLILSISVGAFVALVSFSGLWESALRWLFPGLTTVLHPRADLIVFVEEHLRLVLISSFMAVIVGVPLGIWVTRPNGKDFRAVVDNLTSFGQTFPPVAVLALAVPALGFGLAPTVVALFLYGLLPIVRNTVVGLSSVPGGVVEAAAGVGMSSRQSLLRVEMPLSIPLIIGGIRTSVVINIGTAMVGAVIGAGGLGSPIIAGLVQGNIAFVIEGALPAGMLAVIADRLLENVEKLFSYPSAS